MRDRLRDVRESMEVVHRLLIAAARADYEQRFGRIAGAGLLLELLMNDPFFAWMRPLSGMMAEIDEAFEENTVDAARLLAWRARLEAVLLDERYVRYLQDSADLVIEHAALRRAMTKL